MKVAMQNKLPTRFLFDAMTTDEYEKAKRFYQFLKNITKGSNGVLTIEWEELIDVASGYMKVSPYEAYRILRKMKEYGWIKVIDKHFVIVNTD